MIMSQLVYRLFHLLPKKVKETDLVDQFFDELADGKEGRG